MDMKSFLTLLGKVRRKIWLKTFRLSPTTVSSRQAEYFFDGLSEENGKLVDSIGPVVREAKVAFDIGANAGFFARALFQRGFSGKLVLFEPVPNLLSIAVNTLADVKAEKVFVNSALGEVAGELDLFLPHNSNIGWITAVSEKALTQKKVTVRVSATSAYVKTYLPELIKIDVEGFEVFILRPILNLISDSYRPTIFVEVGWGNENPYWEHFLRLAEGFVEQGYSFYEANESRRKLELDDIHQFQKTTDVIICPIS